MILYGVTLVLLNKMAPYLGNYTLAGQVGQLILLGIPIGQFLEGLSIRGLITNFAQHLVGNLASESSVKNFNC